MIHRVRPFLRTFLTAVLLFCSTLIIQASSGAPSSPSQRDHRPVDAGEDTSGPVIPQTGPEMPVEATSNIETPELAPLTPADALTLQTAQTMALHAKAAEGSPRDPNQQPTGARTDLRPFAPPGWSHPVTPASAEGIFSVDSLYAGQPTRIDWAVLNDSVFPVTAHFQVHLYLDSQRIGSWYVKDLRPGWYAYAHDWRYTVTTPGWHTLRLIADPLGEVAEADELNNQWQMDFYWQSLDQPNLAPYQPEAWDSPLVPSSATNTHTSNTLYAGQPTYIDWAIRNTGPVSAKERTVVALFLDGKQIATWQIDALLPNWQAYIRDWSYIIRDPGWHTLTLQIDVQDAVQEADESDNVWEGRFYWHATTRPNLRPYRPSHWSYPVVCSTQPGTSFTSALYVGQPFYVDWAVINDSHVTISERFEHHLYLDGQHIASWQSNGLGPQAYAQVTDWRHTIQEPGIHKLMLVIDAKSAVAESDETDNVWETEILVQTQEAKRVGVEWVNNYSGTWLASLRYNSLNAGGFYDALGDIGWTQAFNWGDDSAWEEDFKDPRFGGVDDQVMDSVTFGYFSGHGNREGLLFGTYQDDNHLRYDEALWGNGKLNWLVADACEVLNNDDGRCIERWRGAFQGLHMLLGFDTVCYDAPYRGLNLVRYADGTYWWKGTLPIKDAWFQSAAISENASSYSAALIAAQPGIDPSDDYLPDMGEYSADPTEPTHFYLWRVQN